MPEIKGRPYIYSNFAISRDARISFNEPGQEAAVHVTKANPHDRWLMGLLRMRADAVIVGDTTVNKETGHVWTAEFIYPPDAVAFSAQRCAEGRRPFPLLVILTLDGRLNFDATCFGSANQQIVIATTSHGVAKVRDVTCAASLDVYGLGEDAADLRRLVQILQHDYYVNSLLCEGGARVFAAMLDAHLVDEEFVTLCPTFVGSRSSHLRPSYTEGIAWMPDSAPYSRPVSLHRAGDYLFLRTRCAYQPQS
jgi:5-amino-6-(5-phosphoribosylamino)uracil reductase